MANGHGSLGRADDAFALVVYRASRHLPELERMALDLAARGSDKAEVKEFAVQRGIRPHAKFLDIQARAIRLVKLAVGLGTNDSFADTDIIDLVVAGRMAEALKPRE